ncbi:pimeloyl-ACP methyl ester carboxylesterase [Saccharopolyspora erythraea NRRL 2338]|uniref:Alpha/beta fold hydrolase n=1 Tax=Saccharopolyspora erythraea TaxID=1836 RepID=A0ABN1CWN7_SACER|nr:alpha/beta hydrolase [Saccharopolyspora erythraea]EQD86902.1 carboxylesterase [Saccharopolyspora erythraea D]PFG99660.1 pimeloyl-ACP methyl ester carboxylesterase [Saccharopolyspora erythraea NRRL 2338]QRK89547.1 alpha/beta hydrolase [Saccharopolyspora erythraea]
MAFPTAECEAAFSAVYDSVLARWPDDVEALDVPTPYGSTRVHACGDGPPLFLLHGAGTTSMVWFANVGELSRSHRVYAVDQIGDAGRSVHDGRPITALADLMAWLDAVLDHLEVDQARMCGHSYGAWIALHYALHSSRVDRLALLDPTACFARWKLSYLLRAVPMLRPNAKRTRDFLRWETGGAPMDPACLEIQALAASFLGAKVVIKPNPKPAELSVPTLVLVAENSKAHDIRKLIARARRIVPHVETGVLPGVSHHGVPTGNATDVNRRLLRFFGKPAPVTAATDES